MMLDWLNPWWQMSFVVPVPLEPKYVAGRFENETKARVSTTRDGRLLVSRRGRYLGGYLRTVARLTPNETNTEVTVGFSRPKATIWLMLALGILAIGVAVGEGAPLAGNVLSGIWRWSYLFALSPLVSFGIIFAANHASALADADYLKTEITAALTQPPANFWRTLANLPLR